MDIDELLRSVDPRPDAALQANRDLQAMTRAWVAERTSPEILQWPAGGLIERVNERIKKQIERVEEMTGDMDPKTNFGLIVIQTELERWKYLVRGFLRARIAKIDSHTLHYLSRPAAALAALLSPAEAAYAARHQSLLHGHYLASFLASFPAQLQHLNDTAGGISMVDAPDLERAVFVRVLRDCVLRVRGRDQDGAAAAGRGDVVVVRWADVRERVAAEDLELI